MKNVSLYGLNTIIFSAKFSKYSFNVDSGFREVSDVKVKGKNAENVLEILRSRKQ